MDRWHVEKKNKNSERRAARRRDVQRRKEGRGNTEIATEGKNETADRVTRHPGRLVNGICLRTLKLLRLPCVPFLFSVVWIACSIPPEDKVSTTTVVLPPPVCVFSVNQFPPSPLIPSPCFLPSLLLLLVRVYRRVAEKEKKQNEMLRGSFARVCRSVAASQTLTAKLLTPTFLGSSSVRG